MKGKTVRAVAVIPAFNEEARIHKVIAQAAASVAEVLVVDDGSSDATSSAAREAGARVVRLEKNMGVGFATRKGARHALDELGAGRLVFIDADGQHPAEKIPELLAKLDEGFDVAFAARRFNGSMPIVKKMGNAGLTVATRALAGVKLADSQCGFKALTKEAFEAMDLRADRYGICSEIVFETGRNRLKHCEVPIPTIYLEGNEKKGTRVSDGFKVFAFMLGLKLEGRGKR
jgi:glycosyltransferase involved in cell wall biosynthesis